MSLNLFIARPKIKIKSDHQDELKPFFKFIMPFVKVVIYVSSNPLLRISKCDILCILNADEEARRAEIYKRNSSKDPSQCSKTMSINLN